MRIFYRQNKSNQMKKWNENILEMCNEALKFYEQFFQCKYEFVKYDLIFVPNLSSRAMENPGAVTFNENLIRSKMSIEEISRFYQTLVHELCHMWFGNLVTMKWWDDLWLNESFADFMALYCLINHIP